MDIHQKRHQLWLKLSKAPYICAVTKNRSISEVESLLRDLPKITAIGENRWPDCQAKFQHFTQLERHFIGPLQSNKIRKILPTTDVIQSVDSLKLLQKISAVATELQKTVRFCIQVNVSADPRKHGLLPHDLPDFLDQYLSLKLTNVQLIGLMTIGAQTLLTERAKYFRAFKRLFDQINQDFFPNRPLSILSMGMSADFELAIQAGATMIRPGSCLF